MENTDLWVEGDIVDAVCEIRLKSWRHFHAYVVEEMLQYSHYVWRGQRNSDWPLESSLDRLLKGHKPSSWVRLTKGHLRDFKTATRGRRGSNPPVITEENEWWALGQHNGLATPLLDWTESPFVALYFAFEKVQSSPTGERSVWALVQPDDENKTAEQDKEWLTEPKSLTFVRPNQNENARLLSQAGLFTRGPAGRSVEDWIRRYSPGDAGVMKLIKIFIPEEGRQECLTNLNQMNINHATLFPDLYGAGAHCNRALETGSK